MINSRQFKVYTGVYSVWGESIKSKIWLFNDMIFRLRKIKHMKSCQTLFDKKVNNSVIYC